MIYRNDMDTPMVSKKEYAAFAPKTSRWGAPAEFTGIKILVSGDTATLKCIHRSSGRFRAPVTFVMVKENDAWLIMKSSFGRYF